MLYSKFNPNALLDGLKVCGRFALSELSYEHISAGKENHLIKIVPDYIDFSLMVKFSSLTFFENGSISNKDEKVDSSLNISLFNTGKIVSGVYMALYDLPIFNKDSFIRKIKPDLISKFPYLVESSLKSKIENNKDILLAKSSGDIYIEDKAKLLVIDNAIIDDLEKLSLDIFKMDRVLDCKIKLEKENNCHIYYENDNETEIIEFSEDTKIVISFSYITDNQTEEVLDLVERYRNDEIPSDYISKLKKKVKDEIDAYMFLLELKSGSYKVLLEADAADVFFHEAFAAHLLSGTYISQNISTIFQGRKGERFEKLKGINIVMDPTLNDAYGSYEYDHQGVKSKKVMLLEDGYIKDYLTDKSSAVSLEIIEKDELLIAELVKLDDIESLLKRYVDEKHLLRHFTQLKDKISYLLNKYILGELIANSDIDQSLDWRSDRTRLIKESNGHSRVQWWIGIDENGQQKPVSSEARMSNLVIENTNEDNGIDIYELAKDSCIKEGLDFFLDVKSTSGQIDVENGTFIINADVLTKIYVDDRPNEAINPGSFSMSLENFLKKIEYIDHVNEENDGACGASSGFVNVGSFTPRILIEELPYQAAVQTKIVDDVVIERLLKKHI